jgi:hypothetical protein
MTLFIVCAMLACAMTMGLARMVIQSKQVRNEALEILTERHHKELALHREWDERASEALAPYDAGGLLPPGSTTHWRDRAVARPTPVEVDEEYEGEPMSDEDWQLHAYGPDTIYGIVQATIERIDAELDKPYAIARAWADGTLVAAEQRAEQVLSDAHDEFEREQAAAQLQQAHRELAWIYDGGVGAAGIESTAYDAQFAFGQLVERKRREIATRKALGVGNAEAHGFAQPHDRNALYSLYSKAGLIDDTGDTVEVHSWGQAEPIQVQVMRLVSSGFITQEYALQMIEEGER